MEIRAGRAILRTLQHLLPLTPGSRGSRAGRRYEITSFGVPPDSHTVRVGRRTLLQGGTHAAAITAVETDLQDYLAQHARGRIFLHAGVVALRGRAILIPGRSRAGKSTLVRELVRLGAVYYSDEYAVVSPDGMIHPFPRPLGIRDGGGTTRIAIRDLRGKVGRRGIPAGLVLLTRYERGARWTPVPVAPGQAVLALFENAVAARRRAPEVLTALAAIVARAVVRETRRGEARVAARRVLALLRNGGR